MAVKLTGVDSYSKKYEILNSKNELEDEDHSESSLKAEYEGLLKEYHKSIEKTLENGGMAQYWINYSYGQLHRFTNAHPRFELPERHIVPVSDIEKNHRR